MTEATYLVTATRLGDLAVAAFSTREKAEAFRAGSPEHLVRRFALDENEELRLVKHYVVQMYRDSGLLHRPPETGEAVATYWQELAAGWGPSTRAVRGKAFGDDGFSVVPSVTATSSASAEAAIGAATAERAKWLAERGGAA